MCAAWLARTEQRLKLIGFAQLMLSVVRFWPQQGGPDSMSRIPVLGPVPAWPSVGGSKYGAAWGSPSTAALSVARMLRNRIAELKAIRDQTRADAGRASGAEHHTAGAQNLRQAGPQAHADQVGGYAAITCARSLSASKSDFRRSGFMERLTAIGRAKV
jgi:hypothetical protein